MIGSDGVCTYKAELNAPSLEMNAWFFFFFLILKSWFLWKDDDGGPLFWKWMRHDQMPLVCKLMHDFWKPWYLRKIWFLFFFKMDETWPNSLSLEMDIWFLGNLDFFMKRWWWWFFQNGWGMAECPKFRNQCEFWKIFLCRDLNKENFE